MEPRYRQDEDDLSGISGTLLRGYYFFRRSISMSIALFGVLLILIGPVVQQFHPIFGGMFGIWGASFIIVGVGIYVLFWGSHELGKRLDDE